MRKSLTFLLIFGLIAGSLVAPAAAKRKKKKKKPVPVKVERVVEFDYVCPCPGTYQFGSATGTNFGGGPLPISGEEEYIAITAEDASGTAVLVSVNQDVDGDGFNDGVADVCAGSEKGEPAAIQPGLELRLFITTGTCEDGTPSMPMGGTLSVTLSNMP